MIKVFAALLVFTALSAPAAQPEEAFNDSEGASHYQTLLRWYAEGQPVTFDEAKMYFPGRCYVQRKDSVVLGAGLYHLGKNEQGPAFPDDLGSKRLRVGLSSEATWPDNDSNTSSKPTDREWRKISELAFEPVLNWTYDIEPNGRPDMKLELVKNGDFLVMKITNLIEQDLSRLYGLKGRYAAGDAIYSCYFFKQN